MPSKKKKNRRRQKAKDSVDAVAAHNIVGNTGRDEGEIHENNVASASREGIGATATFSRDDNDINVAQEKSDSDVNAPDDIECRNDKKLIEKDLNSSDESVSSEKAANDEFPPLPVSCEREMGARPKLVENIVWKGRRNITLHINKESNVQIGDGTNFIQTRSTDGELRYDTDSRATNKEKTTTISPSKMLIMNQLRDKMKQFKTGHFILITDEIDFVPNIDCLGFVKWLAVFDFDRRGWETGLFSRIKNILQKNAFLNHVCWQETKLSVADNKVTWISLMGMTNRPDTVLDDDVIKWRRKVKLNLTQQMNQIRKFSEDSTTLCALVIWPMSTHRCDHIRVVIETMTDTLDDLNVVIAVPTNYGIPNEENLILLKKYHTVLQVDLQDICKVIQSECTVKSISSPALHRLPTSDGFNCPGITDQEANWLSEDLDVLYLETNEEFTIEQLQDEEEMFYKGGTMSWTARYSGRSTHADIERDNHKTILNFIKVRHIDVCKSGPIKLGHNPGSGGTTLAQRIVWDLKEETPCVQIKHRFGSSVQDIYHKILFLHDKTHLPILALIDGEEEQRVDSILRSLRDTVCIIIVYVQRYWPNIEKNESNNKDLFLLQNHVSKKEAMLLERQHKKEQKLSAEQKHILRELVVKCNTEKVSIFEFGLAVHSYRYNGLWKYVTGYLQTEAHTELQPWHRALLYLSLVYFFGQSSLPCRLFADLPGFGDIYTIKDFPIEMQNLVVIDTNDKKQNMVRISHHLVAKEILNQVLPFPKQTKEFISPHLSPDARLKLGKFSVEFIELASKRSSEEHSSNMAYIMTKTFISRNNKQVGETETMISKKRKPQLSPLLEQASTKDPFTERFHIYDKLTKCFPKKAQFKAHLGRLYSICRPEEEKLAEKYLSEALEESLAEVKDTPEDDISYTNRLDLMHIYHMYGYMIQRKLSKITGRTHGESKRVDDFKQISTSLIKDIKRACEYFTECRKMTPIGCEQCFGYVNEILVRLMFCEFVNTNSGFKNVLEFLDTNESDAADFVRDSCVVLDELFVDCFSVIEPELMDDSIGHCQEWYSALFRRIPGHMIPNIGDGVQSRRLEIARIKMKYSEPNRYGVLELITNANDIKNIADRYEMNIAQYENNHDVHSVSKRQMNMDYMEWLYVIRHRLYKPQLTIEQVLLKVEPWYEIVRSPQSRFYLFVLKSLIGFGINGNSYHKLLIEAKELKDEVLKFSRHVTKPKYPREWLGLPQDNIRRLFPGLRFFGQIEGREISSEDLEIRKGTILPPNDKPSGGYIDLDLGPQNRVSIRVFYIPARTEENLKGIINKEVRVEFVLCFSLLHGYEAFNVKRLSTVKCVECNIDVEKRSTDKQVTCSKCNRTFPVGRSRRASKK